MISDRREGARSRRVCPAALVAAVLAVAAAVPGAALAAPAAKQRAQAAQQPQQTIDAQRDPQAAAAALDTGTCPSCITWQTETAPGGCQNAQPAPPASPPPGGVGCVPAGNDNTRHYVITDGWGPPAVFGDVLYNCSQSDDADTESGVSDERMESTSLSERVSLKISLKLLDTVGESAEVSAFSRQAVASATTVTVEQGVIVAPGFKGWTTTQVKTVTVPGSAYVTDGIATGPLTLIQNMNLSFPGRRLDPSEQESSWVGHQIAMTAAERKTICDTDPVNTAMYGYRVFGSGLPARKPSTFALRMCGPTGRCTSREVTGTLPPSRIRRATARLTRAGRTYGRGTYTRGHTRLHARRELTAGTYRLRLTQRPPKSQRTRNNHMRAMETVVPVTVS